VRLDAKRAWEQHRANLGAAARAGAGNDRAESRRTDMRLGDGP
jgi:hypothetical protein